MEKKAKKKFEPNGFVIIFIIIILCALMTWVVPAGEFDRAEDPGTGRMVVVAGSYQEVESNPVTPAGLLISVYNGFVESADIMFFIVFASSYVFLLSKTGALNALTGAMLRMVGNKDSLIIPVFMLFFSIGGTTFGMFEECYALIPAFIVISLALGYDRIVGGAIVFVGVATGFAAATLNPFTIGIASSLAEIPLVGERITPFRVIAFILFNALTITYTTRYAMKIKKDPTKSIMYGTKEDTTGMLTREECMAIPFTRKQKISMFGFLLLIAALVWGIVTQGWYLAEIAALFFGFMLVTALINGYSFNEIAETFVESTKSTIGGVLLVGFARGAAVVMNDGLIIDTAVNFLANLVGTLPTALSGVGMLAVQNLVNFFIPSGSGQAVVMMPIMAPLADLLGISREMAVTAYQFGDGFSNMFWPTACAVECGIMGISLGQWYKFITKLFIMMFCLQAILMVVGISMGI